MKGRKERENSLPHVLFPPYGQHRCGLALDLQEYGIECVCLRICLICSRK